MIEPTDEMIIAWRDAMKAAAAEAVRAGAPLGRSQEIAHAGLAAVLAIVERDYCLKPQGHESRPCPATMPKLIGHGLHKCNLLADHQGAHMADTATWSLT